MQQNILETPVEFIKGVGPLRAELLKKELGIFTAFDLAQHFPFRYIDKSKYHTVADVVSDQTEIQIIGKITGVTEVGAARKKRLVAKFADETGQIELVWFKGIKWVKPTLQLNTPMVIYGKPSKFSSKFNMVHPEIEPLEKHKKSLQQGLQPVYSTTEKLSAKGLNSRGIAKIMQQNLQQILPAIAETLNPTITQNLKLMPLRDAYRHAHFPTDLALLKHARNRLKFDELFFVQLAIINQKNRHRNSLNGLAFKSLGGYFNTYYNHHLPFELTNAQKRVLKEIRNNMRHGHHMNRLIQGDVGSGKTMVAMLCMLMALDNGCQAALMAPTEILAQQHFASLQEALQKINVNVALLTGSTKTAQRKVILTQLAENKLQILVGTHALIEDPVKFCKLGLVVIDEQHRFGVAQRAKLWQKGPKTADKKQLAPHILVMTATPIPRTLAMSLYGDLDVSVIDELPPGRKPVTTTHRYENNRLRVIGFLKEELKKGRQAYIVFPLVEESETLDYKNLTDGFEHLLADFPPPQYQLSMVHGRMKPEDKNIEMERFAKGETQILVATTVIEVGVNVPNASIMIIENAEKFGLSQLHQLRGRVGRGAEKSYCILMTTHKLTDDARTRLETMVRTNDGFEIAEVDLRLRGPGDIMGTRQSGLLNFKIADLAKDQQLLQLARQWAENVLEKDPKLQLPENANMRTAYLKKNKHNVKWSRIS